MEYRELRKVISINIVYFDLGQGIDYIYRGLTEFKGIHKNDLLKLSSLQQKKFSKLDHVAIFPEYYILKVNDFDNHSVDTLDEWIYVLKNSEVPDGFSAKGLERASKELDLMKLSDADRKSYERYIADRRSLESSIETSWFEGHEKGIEKGIEKGKIGVALEMIREGESNDKIRKYTGLTDDAIDKLCGDI